MNHGFPVSAILVSLLAAVFFLTIADANAAGPGIFEKQTGIGTPKHAGSVIFDEVKQTYTITGGGENMWFTNDAFHFVWKKMTGDMTLAADISFLGQGGNPHRKACLVIRQSLDPDSVYADAALHGVGLTSLQWRDTKGGQTRETQVSQTAPQRLRLEKRGKYVSLSIGDANGDLHAASGWVPVAMNGPLYVGLGVCAHDDNTTETAVFSNVELKGGSGQEARSGLISALETVEIASKDRRVIYCTSNHIEAPNWSRDAALLYFNSRGHIYHLPVTGGEPQLLDTGFAKNCNNDHGISPDGTMLAISDQSRGGHSLIYTLPITGGAPKLITGQGPSYWHGWSPDGKTLAYCAERNGEFDIYTIPVDGGEETRLTTAKGLDDGPDYSADGKYIYFNSERTGQMQIWRMKPDGSDQEQVTSDGYNNWFAHPSPNGRWLVFLSYEKDVTGHPANKDVRLRIMPLNGGKIEELATLFGGQGTINVPSWSPDSSRLAFVSYQLIQ